MSPLEPCPDVGATVSTYLFPAMLLLPSSEMVVPPQSCNDLATCPVVGTATLDVLVDVEEIVAERPASLKVEFGSVEVFEQPTSSES